MSDQSLRIIDIDDMGTQYVVQRGTAYIGLVAESMDVMDKWVVRDPRSANSYWQGEYASRDAAVQALVDSWEAEQALTA